MGTADGRGPILLPTTQEPPRGTAQERELLGELGPPHRSVRPASLASGRPAGPTREKTTTSLK
jgi:hypothetical protein